MAEHHEAVVTVTVGNDTEGLKMDPDMVEMIYPNLSDAHAANGIRDMVVRHLVTVLSVLHPEQSYQQIVDYIDQHVEYTH